LFAAPTQYDWQSTLGVHGLYVMMKFSRPCVPAGVLADTPWEKYDPVPAIVTSWASCFWHE